MMNKRETTMKNDEKERKNNETLCKRENTMKNDEQIQKQQ